MAARDEATPDADLLRMIAQQRDRGAFELLTQRHAQALYSTASHIAGGHQAAEDAVQETLLDIWRRAGNYDPALGNARSWLCRMVAHKALKANRKNCKARRLCGKLGQEPSARYSGSAAPAAGPAPFGPEQEEALAALRGLLGQLDSADLRLIALYYGAGFSQHETATALRLTQRKVSAHLTRILRHLQSCLKEYGFATALPGVELLGEALRSALPLPACLRRALGFAASEAGRSKALEPRGAFLLALPVFLACGLVVLAAGIHGALGSSEPADSPTGASVSPVPAGAAGHSGLGSAHESAPGPQGGTRRFKHRWDFDSSGQLTVLPPAVRLSLKSSTGAGAKVQPLGFVAAVEGQVKQVMGKGVGRGGCLEFGAGGGQIALGFGAARFPLKVSFVSKNLSKDAVIEGRLSGTSWGVRFDNMAHPVRNTFEVKKGAFAEHIWYLTTTTHDCWVKDAGRLNVFFPISPADGQGLFIEGNTGLLLDELSLQEIDLTEAPDLSDFTQAFARLWPLVRSSGRSAVLALGSGAAPGVPLPSSRIKLGP